MSASGTATGQVEHMLRQVTPGRYDAYEALLRALATPTPARSGCSSGTASPAPRTPSTETCRSTSTATPLRHLRPGTVGERLEPLLRSGRRPRRGPHPVPRPLRPLAQPARAGRRRRHPLAGPAPDRHRPGAPARGTAPPVRTGHRDPAVLRPAHAERPPHPGGPRPAPRLGAARARSAVSRDRSGCLRHQSMRPWTRCAA